MREKMVNGDGCACVFVWFEFNSTPICRLADAVHGETNSMAVRIIAVISYAKQLY